MFVEDITPPFCVNGSTYMFSEHIEEAVKLGIHLSVRQVFSLTSFQSDKFSVGKQNTRFQLGNEIHVFSLKVKYMFSVQIEFLEAH